MKKSIAKVLRHSAEEKTIGEDKSVTRKLYRKFKKGWKDSARKKVEPKIKISKRQQRITA